MKARKKKTSARALHSDFGPIERQRHDQVVIERAPADMGDTTNRDRARVIDHRDPLWYYRRNRHITARERDAGFVLRELRARTGLEPSVVGAYSEMVGNGSLPALRIASIDHYQRYTEAMRMLPPNVSDAVYTVCCAQQRLGYGGIKHLKAGLKILARHFHV